MKTFAIVVVSLYILRALWMALRLCDNDYPVIKYHQPWEDVLRMLVAIGLAAWGIVVIL